MSTEKITIQSEMSVPKDTNVSVTNLSFLHRVQGEDRLACEGKYLGCLARGSPPPLRVTPQYTPSICELLDPAKLAEIQTDHLLRTG